MCDYSLHGIKNRLANEGEQLFIHKFHTGSKGLASVSDLRNLEKPAPAPVGAGIWARFKCWVENQRRWINDDMKRALPAVCIPPGARLQVDGIPATLQKQFGVGPHEEVTFVQLTAEPFRYRDAIRFHNGQEVLLQKLSDGLRMDVMSLSLVEETPVPKHAARSSILEQVSVG
ncbi:MAG: hypothetical protein J2P21_11395 [Chloracidobacterium sp.]|nr:hypothetical protein [Chloracidobacterium sp.]